MLTLFMSPTGAETESGIQNVSDTGNVYDGFYFTVTFPDGWDVVDQWRINRDMVIMGDGTSAVAITARKASQNETLPNLIDHELSAMKEIHPGYTTVSQEEVTFLGEPAVLVTGSYTSGGETIDVRHLYGLVNGMDIALTWSSPQGIDSEPFQNIIDSFSLKSTENAISGDALLWSQKDGLYSLSYPDLLHLDEIGDSNAIVLENAANHTVMKVDVSNTTRSLDSLAESVREKMRSENITILDESQLVIDENPAVLILFEQPRSGKEALKGFELYVQMPKSTGETQILSLVTAYPSTQFNEVYPVLADIVNSLRIPAKSKDKYWYYDPYEYLSIDDWIEYGILTDYIDYGLDFDLWNYGYGLTFTDADYMEEMLGWDNYYLYDTDTSSWYREYDPTYIADLWAMDPDEYFAADHLVETAYDDF